MCVCVCLCVCLCVCAQQPGPEQQRLKEAVLRLQLREENPLAGQLAAFHFLNNTRAERPLKEDLKQDNGAKQSDDQHVPGRPGTEPWLYSHPLQPA